ncbi:MAG: YicC family protein [FCB group bacterium]|nr:YicC family protein [FCB group bacterium]MBL7027898.1 YicC family protein [Candidatus Neomarinimicrobiota bacterium]MBL7121907.1 YicC family protein [Candidatus Neomarinimicrobiota bacterium]
MLISMTGYGRAEEKIGDLKVVIELRAVNSRFLEFVMRLPRGYEKVEDAARTHLQSLLTRGRVTLTMNMGTDQSAIGKPRMNEELLQHYQQIADNSAQILGRQNETLSIAELLRFPDVITYDTDAEDQDKINEALLSLVKKASGQLQAMRLREGEMLEEAILEQIGNIVEIISKIQTEDSGRLELIADKIRKKVAESSLAGESQIDEKRLEQEIVLWSDKLDIAEELTRLEAHIQHFRELMVENGDAGKRLNFLLQEMNREANTVGSKANSTPIGHAVVELKNEIERIREQVQNIQ